jgi:translation initiation factor 5B
VAEGIVKVGTPICVPDQDNLEIGRVVGLERDHKAVQEAKKGESVAVKIEGTQSQSHITIGRHFSSQNPLYSRLTRGSIDCLKAHYKEEVSMENWRLVVQMKKIFAIE